MKRTLSIEVERYSPGIMGFIEAMGTANAVKAAYVIIYAFSAVLFLCVAHVALNLEGYLVIAGAYQFGSLPFGYYVWQAVRFHRGGAEK